MKKLWLPVLLGCDLILASALSTLPGAWASSPITLEFPPGVILPGDLLTLRSSQPLFSDEQLRTLEFFVGKKRAEFIRIDPNTVQLVVPDLPAGIRTVQVVEILPPLGRLQTLFAQNIQISQIQVTAGGESKGGPFLFGLNFVDTKNFSVGSAVEGWLEVQGLSSVKGAVTPVSVTGKITGKRENIISLSLVSDVNKTSARLILGSLDLATGGFFGELFSPGQAVQIGGTAAIEDLPKISKPRSSPVITLVTPKQAKPGQQIEITGSGFGQTQGVSRAVFAGKPVIDFLSVVSWSDTRVVARLAPFDLGFHPIRVTVGFLPSNPFPIEVLPPCPSVGEFVRIFGGNGFDEAFSVQQTDDCGFILAGRTTSFGAGDFDAYVIKTDLQGNERFSRTFGGRGFDEFRSVQQTADGGYIFAGQTTSPEFRAADSDFLVVRTDSEGRAIWIRTFGGKGKDEAFSVRETGQNAAAQGGIPGFIVAGRTTSFGAGSTDAFLVKLDPDGNEELSRTFGGRGFDEFRSVEETADEGFILAGRTDSPEFRASDSDVFLVKTDNLGNGQFTRIFGGGGFDAGHEVQQTTDAGYSVGGVTDSPELRAVGRDFFLVKTDPQGRQLFSRTFGGRGADEALSAQQTTDEGFILAGVTDSAEFAAAGRDVFLVKTNCQGGPEANRAFNLGPADVGHSVRQTADEGFILAGESLRGTRNTDVILIKAAPFRKTLPEIVSFSANGVEHAEIEPNGSVTLFWTVRNADQLRVEKVSGPGPELALTFPGGPEVSNERDLQFTVNQRACFNGADGCGDTIYRLTATRGGCDNVEAHVTVSTVLSERARRLFEIEDVVLQRFDLGELPGLDVAIPSHPDVVTDPLNAFGRNRCFSGQGLPYVRISGILSNTPFTEIDDREPVLLLYRPDGQLAGWAYGTIFTGLNPPPQGLPVDDTEWLGHWGGWHPGDGGMVIFGIFPDLQPPLVCPSPLDASLRAPLCGAFPPPFIPHPALWDVHFNRDFDSGPPRVGPLTSEVGLPDPCAGVPDALPDCDSGLAPVNRSIFFDVGDGPLVGGVPTFIPVARPCSP